MTLVSLFPYSCGVLDRDPWGELPCGVFRWHGGINLTNLINLTRGTEDVQRMQELLACGFCILRQLRGNNLTNLTNLTPRSSSPGWISSKHPSSLCKLVGTGLKINLVF